MLRPIIRYEASRDEVTPSAVVVEAWKHISCGRGKRAFHAEFTEAQRRSIREYWYPRCYKWYLVTGFPETATFNNLESFKFFKRMCDFFASV